MEERLLHLLETEHLSSSKFADVIGVQRSSVSHILSGRNKPSFDFMQKTLKAFPALNADWLILGEGDMYEGTVSSGGGDLFAQVNIKAKSEDERGMLGGDDEIAKSAENDVNLANIQSFPGTGRDNLNSQALNLKAESKKISRVILFYDDNSFDTYEPGS